MADTRGLKVNKDIYDFETMIYGTYDSLPAKHKHTLSELMLCSVLEMRHHSNLACHYHKGQNRKKAELFSLALGFCADVQDSMDHLYDINLISSKRKAALDEKLDEIRDQLSRLVNSFSKQITKGAERREYASGGDSIHQEEG